MLLDAGFGRKFFINQNFESCCFRSGVSLIYKVNRFAELKLVPQLIQIELSHKHNSSLNNFHDKTTLVQYSICDLN